MAHAFARGRQSEKRTHERNADAVSRPWSVQKRSIFPNQVTRNASIPSISIVRQVEPTQDEPEPAPVEAAQAPVVVPVRPPIDITHLSCAINNLTAAIEKAVAELQKAQSAVAVPVKETQHATVAQVQAPVVAQTPTPPVATAHESGG